MVSSNGIHGHEIFFTMVGNLNFGRGVNFLASFLRGEEGQIFPPKGVGKIFFEKLIKTSNF